jgi:hypothetical protein
MRVEQLIEELSRLPGHLPVTAVLGEVYIADESGGAMVTLCHEDSLEVTDVRNEGNQVLLWADGMHL